MGLTTLVSLNYVRKLTKPDLLLLTKLNDMILILDVYDLYYY